MKPKLSSFLKSFLGIKSVVKADDNFNELKIIYIFRWLSVQDFTTKKLGVIEILRSILQNF